MAATPAVSGVGGGGTTVFTCKSSQKCIESEVTGGRADRLGREDAVVWRLRGGLGGNRRSGIGAGIPGGSVAVAYRGGRGAGHGRNRCGLVVVECGGGLAIEGGGGGDGLAGVGRGGGMAVWGGVGGAGGGGGLLWWRWGVVGGRAVATLAGGGGRGFLGRGGCLVGREGVVWYDIVIRGFYEFGRWVWVMVMGFNNGWLVGLGGEWEGVGGYGGGVMGSWANKGGWGLCWGSLGCGAGWGGWIVRGVGLWLGCLWDGRGRGCLGGLV
ncbi:hypothetical protein Tco_0773088 [Tanacetum coccineum]|uniref:Uncharacterized protein n=1 Tax=Tanacetum coccineum TaxID=301880 RepID=A0ABQ4ZKR7_9ASTR